MNFKKIIASLLAAVTLCGAVSVNTFGAQIDIGDIGDLTYDPTKFYEFKLKDDGTYEITKHKGIEDSIGFTYTVDIPSTYNGKPVTSIGKCAFAATASVRYDNIDKIIIPEGITSIGTWAFADMAKLSEITIPSSVKYVGQEIFSDTPFLEAKRAANPLVIINNILIDGQTASGNVVIPDGVTFFSECAFSRNEKIESVSIPESVNVIADLAFNRCSNLKSVKLPDKLTSIGSWAFNMCPITEITLPKSLNSIGTSAFWGTDIKKINIPEGIEAIDDFTFYGCTKLQTVNIPNSVKSIGANAFAQCQDLTEIIIPKSVNEIKSSAFYNAYLNSITINNPKCIIADQSDTINKGFTKIIGYKNSTAQAYAEKYNHKFLDLASQRVKGDANGDGKLSIKDAAFIAKKIAQRRKDELDTYADFNDDGKITVKDAVEIAKYIARRGK